MYEHLKLHVWMVVMYGCYFLKREFASQNHTVEANACEPSDLLAVAVVCLSGGMELRKALALESFIF